MNILEDLKNKFKEDQLFTYSDSGYSAKQLNQLVDEGCLYKKKIGTRNHYCFTPIDNNIRKNKLNNKHNIVSQSNLLHHNNDTQYEILQSLQKINKMIDINAKGGIYIWYLKKDPRYIYIGQTKNFVQRYEDHVNMLINDSHHSPKFQQLFNENGKDINNFKFKPLIYANDEGKNLDILESKTYLDYENNNYYIILNKIKPPYYKDLQNKLKEI